MPFVESTEPRPYPNTEAIMATVKPVSYTVPASTKSKSNIDEIPIPDVYAPFPPALTSDMNIPKRVNPLRPQAPERRTVSLETTDPNQHNIERKDLMARREHYRIHHTWSRYYYGNIAEKELFRRYIREGLKQQMQEQETKKKEDFSKKIRECEAAVKQDKEDIEKDQVSHSDHHRFLTQYRDANKSMMEEREYTRRQNGLMEKSVDREILKYNPINWSGSLV